LVRNNLNALPLLTSLILILSIVITPQFAMKENSTLAFGEVEPLDEPNLTVQTDRPSYDIGDNITVFGNISESLLDKTQEHILVFELLNPRGNLVRSDQIQILENGSYNYNFPIGGLQNLRGTYTVIVTFQSNIQAKTSFEWPVESPLSCIQLADLQLNFESGRLYVLKISNNDYPFYYRGYGTIQNVTVNSENNSLVIDYKPQPSPQDIPNCLALQLPGTIIDSKQGGQDARFIVLENGQSVLIHEGKTFEENLRRISIELNSTTNSRIEVIGTHVIPEFVSGAAMSVIATVASISIILLTRFRKLA
jgi:hypothetical protein